MDGNGDSSMCDQLIKQYKSIGDPSPSLSWLSKDPEKAMSLLRAIKRQVEWSLDHADHTSPYHDALTSLYLKCPKFENIGMCELFIDEFILGTRSCKSNTQTFKALNAALAAQNAWDESQSPRTPIISLHTVTVNHHQS